MKVFFIPEMALSNISFMSDHFYMLLAKFLDISRYGIDNRYDQVWVDALSGPDEEYEHDPLLPGPHQEQEAEHPHVATCSSR